MTRLITVTTVEIKPAMDHDDDDINELGGMETMHTSDNVTNNV